MDIETDALFSMAALENHPYTFRREKQERLKCKEKPFILPCSYQFVNFPAELIGVSHGSGSLHLHLLSPQTSPSMQRATAEQGRLSTEVTLDDNIIRMAVPASPRHQADPRVCFLPK